MNDLIKKMNNRWLKKRKGHYAALINGKWCHAENIKGEWVLSVERKGKLEICDIFFTLKELKESVNNNITSI